MQTIHKENYNKMVLINLKMKFTYINFTVFIDQNNIIDKNNDEGKNDNTQNNKSSSPRIHPENNILRLTHANRNAGSQSQSKINVVNV